MRAQWSLRRDAVLGRSPTAARPRRPPARNSSVRFAVSGRHYGGDCSTVHSPKQAALETWFDLRHGAAADGHRLGGLEDVAT